MKLTQHTDETHASPDELREAIERLTSEELYRLKKAAGYYLYGSEYQSSTELLNEAIVRAMSASVGGQGRTWKRSVNFMAFLVMCMRGIANDSAKSTAQTCTTHIECLATEALTCEDVLGAQGHSHLGVEDCAIEAEEVRSRQMAAKVDLDTIDRQFEGDEKVSWIIMGYKDELTAEEIRTMAGMSAIEYDTAKRRFRRGLDKIFPNRRMK